MRVISGAVADRRTTPLEEAYAHFRLDRQGLPVSPATLRLYEHTIGRFLRWVREEHPEVRRFEDLSVVAVREYRAALGVIAGHAPHRARSGGEPAHGPATAIGAGTYEPPRFPHSVNSAKS